VRILFVGRRYTYFRNFDSVVRALAARGHQVHLAVEREGSEGRPPVEQLAKDYPNVTFGAAPESSGDDWRWAASRLRHGLEYLRYQDRMFSDTPKIRDRSRERTPGAFVTLGDAIRRYAPWSRRPVSALVDWFERAIPEDQVVRAFVESQRPELLVITPLIGLGSQQIDYLRVGRALGIPTALGVWSWDHLSSKALIRDLPDRVFVWNDTQKQEARRLHRVPEDRIVVTGAQCFDQWFDRQPSRDRTAFCRAVGLGTERPFLLYVCSAPFLGSQPEAPFVADWIGRLRGSGLARLRDLPIVVRPHPSRRAEWDAVDLSGFSDVVLWGGPPVDANARADYFDSLYHSALVVGLNTSAFIEAGIVGRPVFTILLPEWYENQLGTVHFRYLFEAGGGLLTSATTYDAHFSQLDEALARPLTQVRPFVRAFVRPHGLDVPATPIFVEQVEAMRTIVVPPPTRPRFEQYARRWLEKVLPWRHEPGREHLVYSERELGRVARIRGSRSIKATRERALKQAHIQARAEDTETRRAARQAELEAYRARKREQERSGTQTR
jgi:hypothetical protein